MSTSHARHGQVEGEGPSAKEVLGYLRELLEQSEFNASERNRRFLSYVVEETLQGRADRIKAYNIALAAFDRTAEFDPLTDPIVRIEASRLRRSLEHYYLTAGREDPIRIEIPKGSYAATFSYRTAAADGPAQAMMSPVHPVVATLSTVDRWLVVKRYRLAVVMVVVGLVVGSLASYGILTRMDHAMPASAAAAAQAALMVLPFEDTSGSSDPSVARGLTFDVGVALTRLENVAVFAPEPGFASRSPAKGLHSDFTLIGSVQVDSENMRVAVFLMDSRTGQFLQSWTFLQDIAAKGLINAQADVARQLLAFVRTECVRKPMAGVGASSAKAFDCRLNRSDMAG